MTGELDERLRRVGDSLRHPAGEIPQPTRDVGAIRVGLSGHRTSRVPGMPDNTKVVLVTGKALVVRGSIAEIRQALAADKAGGPDGTFFSHRYIGARDDREVYIAGDKVVSIEPEV